MNNLLSLPSVPNHETAASYAALDDALLKITVSQNNATALRNAFAPHFEKAHGLALDAASVKTDDPKMARSVRLALKGARTAAEHTRKEQKDDSLRFGKAVDGIYNVLEFQVVPLEKALLEIEEMEERAEAKRKSGLQTSRSQALLPYMDPIAMDLGSMPDAGFAALLEGAKKAYSDKVALESKAKADEIERQRIADEQRKAKEEAARVEREKMRLENERLVKEVEEERYKRAKQEADAKNEREHAEVAARVAKAEADRLAQIELNRRDAAEKELARIAREQADKAASDTAAAKKAKSAPDREKLAALASAVRNMPVPVLATDAGVALVARIADQVNRFATWLDAEAGKL